MHQCKKHKRANGPKVLNCGPVSVLEGCKQKNSLNGPLVNNTCKTHGPQLCTTQEDFHIYVKILV